MVWPFYPGAAFMQVDIFVSGKFKLETSRALNFFPLPSAASNGSIILASICAWCIDTCKHFYWCSFTSRLYFIQREIDRKTICLCHRFLFWVQLFLWVQFKYYVWNFCSHRKKFAKFEIKVFSKRKIRLKLNCNELVHFELIRVKTCFNTFTLSTCTASNVMRKIYYWFLELKMSIWKWKPVIVHIITSLHCCKLQLIAIRHQIECLAFLFCPFI